MIELRKISANPWDYTLYKSPDGIFVLKVMFSEGEYKIDIGRYFQLPPPEEGALDGEGITANVLKELAEEIRSNYPSISYPELEKTAIKLVS
ncbi:hypothetical protein CCUG62472_00014 [Mycobacteroides salmoniphilum]|nr:hypothetical protein CCUG62472_00014 [Mycobacteroides salmoniphilum]